MRKDMISLPDGNCRVPRQRSSLSFFSGRKVSFSVLRRGSMTAEAAGALPLFFLGVLSMICMMDLYGTFTEQVVKLQEQAETAAMAASAAGEYAPGVIDLPVGFTYRPQWYPEALPGVRIAVRGRVHTWTGREPGDGEPEEETKQEKMVYVTEYESVYHTSAECTHLSLSVRAVGGDQVSRLRNEDGKAYHACDKCVGSGARNGTVYITQDGTHYHNAADCSGLTRSVRLVKESETEGLPLCSRCQKLAA